MQRDLYTLSGVAQLAERLTVNQNVVVSSTTPGALTEPPSNRGFRLFSGEGGVGGSEQNPE